MAAGRLWLIDGDEEGRDEDLQFPAQAINPPGAASDPSRNSTTGLLEFSKSATNIVAGSAQLPHAWFAGTDIVPHVHIYGTTTAPGVGTDGARWTLDYKWYNIDGAVPAAYTTLSQTFTVPALSGGRPVHFVGSFGSVSGAGFTESSVVEWKLSRLGGDAADTYDDILVLVEFDIHYKHCKMGKDI